MRHPQDQIETIARAVLMAEGHLLLCRGVGSSLSYLPGGHVEFGENAIRALERELQEELAIETRAGRFLGVVEHSFTQDGEAKHEINLLFEVTGSGLDAMRVPASNEPGRIAFEWLRIDGLEESDLEPASLRFLLAKWIFGRESNYESTVSSGEAP